jgi:hypothetical protein
MDRLRVLLLLPLVASAACVTREKSENPLGPSVAGPIPGVSITAPLPIEPKDGLKIAVGQQPVMLVLQNAESSGVRPLSYQFEVATDTNFSNKVFVREGIAPGDGNRTAFRLPEALGPERTYYWRALALDGANTGPYSAFAFFSVFTPIVIQRPVPQSPINNARIDTPAPQFTIGNAPRSGPAGAIIYEVDLAANDSFTNRVAIWQIAEQPNTTRFTGSGLALNTQYFWRVRGFDSTTVGPWSDTQVFRTPLPAPVPSPIPTPGGSCASAGSEEAIVACRRRQFPGFMSNGQIVAMLRGVAQDLNAGGYPFRPYGILQKTSGTQCNGYSCDIICSGNGGNQRQWDVLIDAQGSQSPTWDSIGSITPRVCEF